MVTTIKFATEIIKTVSSLKAQGLRIGFVPTMGALHDGHLKLIKKSKQDNDVTIVSIFVNPTQFNDKKDLEKYPANLEQDQLLLTSIQTDILYAPNVGDIYPDGMEIGSDIDLGGLDRKSVV